MTTGRPTDYTEELADSICERLAAGESMRSVSRDKGMPASCTMFRWLRIHPVFREQYEKAKVESADALVEEIMDIADDGTNDWMENLDHNGEKVGTGWKLNGEHIQRSRLRVDARKWAASKLKPKKYGEKIQQEVTIKTKIEDMSDEELDAFIASKSE
jgi:hypothetical protein